MNHKIVTMVLLLSSIPHVTVRGVITDKPVDTFDIVEDQDEEEAGCCYEAAMLNIDYATPEDLVQDVVDIACYAVNKIAVIENRQESLEKRVSVLEGNIK
jgi:hypothetical protein